MDNVLANHIFARFCLSFTNDEQSVLDVDLQIPANGITAIFGASGSGKTSLLRCIAGLTHAKDGQLVMGNEVWQNEQIFIPTHKRPLGYVFQELSLFSHLTAKGNLDYAIKRSKTKKTDDLYNQVIALMGIEPILNRYPAQLSGGERQRVAISRALLIRPQILLMDEPLASLDAARKQEILPYLEKLRANFNIPILYVSHSMEEVARLADHVILLEQGKAVVQGSISDVFSHIDLPLPVGSDANVIWQGKISQKDNEWGLSQLSFGSGNLWVADDSHKIGDDVRVRILAKDVSLALNNHEDTSILNRLKAEVYEIVPNDDKATVLVRLKIGNHYLIASLTKRSLHHLNLHIGQHLWAQIKSVALIH